MNHILETYKNELTNEVLNIYQDDCPSNPRDWDTNLTEMFCIHNRYILGDLHDLRGEDFNGWGEIEAYLLDTEDIIAIKPLYLYDHGGLSISTSPFSCRWDSGQIGFIFVTKYTVFEQFGEIDNAEEIAERALEEELKLYGDYMRGDVFFAELTEDGVRVDITRSYGYEGLLENVCDAFGLDPKHFEEI